MGEPSMTELSKTESDIDIEAEPRKVQVDQRLD
jgi:hypothetical protein